MIESVKGIFVYAKLFWSFISDNFDSFSNKRRQLFVDGLNEVRSRWFVLYRKENIIKLYAPIFYYSCSILLSFNGKFNFFHDRIEIYSVEHRLR